jgi:uncharacterized protein YbjQ (UPF0145 family)
MNKKKIVATVGLALGVVATALLASPLGANPMVHMICDTAIKVLAAFGLIVPVSFMAPASSSTPAPTKQPDGASLKSLLPLMLIAVAMSGCATTNRIVADEATKCGPGILSAYAQSKNVLMTATSKEAALGELMAIAQAVGADASSVYCVVMVIVNDLKAARSQDGGSVAASAQMRPLVAGGDSMYPADPVAHGIALGQDILATKPVK